MSGTKLIMLDTKKVRTRDHEMSNVWVEKLFILPVPNYPCASEETNRNAITMKNTTAADDSPRRL